MDRHLIPPDVERLSGEQLNREAETKRYPAVTAWCRQAVADYLAPAPDPVTARVDGFQLRDV